LETAGQELASIQNLAKLTQLASKWKHCAQVQLYPSGQRWL